ncbi:MAG: hypothetical protein QM718_14640 [Steroidobacteraceae bacterium]
MSAAINKAVCVGLFAVGVVSTSVAAPDFSGPWETTAKNDRLKTVDGKDPPLTAEGRKMLQANSTNLKDDPAKRCLPPGVPRAMMQSGFAFNFVVGQDVAGMFFEWNHLPRPIWMNIAHFENIGPTYLGQSVGQWDGDTLVVNTNGFNETTWLDSSGLPHSDQLETVERIRLKDANTLEDQITFMDSKVFAKPWTTVLTFQKRPGYVVKEDFCLKRLNINAVASE